MAYGFRLLVDIAERSLSESPYQDPTTAVQAIDRLHDCLRQLARRTLPDGVHRDRDGNVRFVMPAMSWDAYVNLAFDEIRQAGTRSMPVTRRLESVLRDLIAIAPVERRPSLERQRSLLESAVNQDTADPRVATFALAPDPEGIGEAAHSHNPTTASH